ncbi:MAG: hypothetical protein KBS69_04085, partial [Bacteroidales bacterium]|nr:hypothetical protein [Candidatus Colicola caccequi]
MKKTLLFGLASVMLLCSFSLKNLFGSKSTTTAPTTETTTTVNPDGKAAGAALRTLYTNYKAAGKFDVKDPANILNTISLISSCKNLKEKASDKSYWSSFASGLVTGSEDLVTEEISDQVTEGLNTLMSNVDTSKLETVADKAATVKT